MNVTLTWAEVSVAARIGEARTIRNRAKGNGQRHGHADCADWSGDIEAVAAEMAAAKAIGVYFPVLAEADPDGDLGYGIHVRATARADGRLILHKDDQDGGLFILVTGTIPTFAVPGFVEAEAAKDDAFWTDPGTGRPAYFIPQNVLHPIKGLVIPRPVTLPPDWPTAYERNS